MATYKKRLYGTRLDKAIEELDKSVYVTEVDGKKVNDINSIYPKNKTKRLLDEGYKATASKAPKKITSKKKDASLLEKVGYTAKEAGAGVVSGLTGIGTALTTELADNLRQGNERDTSDVFGDLLLGVFSPATYLGKKTVESFKNNFGDDTKTTKQKIVGSILDAGPNSMEAMLPVENMIKATGTILPNTVDDKVMELGEAIQAPSNRLRESLDKEAAQYGTGWQTAGQVGNVVGNMIPSIAATVLTKNPTVGMATMGISAKGNSTTEALKRGADLEQAVKIGNAKAAVEVGAEMLTGGLNIFGKGALDDIITRGIDKKVKNEVLNYVAQKGMGVVGEVGEETITDILNTVIDQGTVDPNATYSIDDFGETAVTTMLSTAVLNAITGGYGSSSYKANAKRMQENNYSQNEETVINSIVGEYSNALTKQKAFENEIEKAITAKETEQGGKLSDKEKNAFREQINSKIESGEIDVSSTKLKNKEISAIREIVEEEMQKGLLDTNKIESILGTTITEQDSVLARSYEETAKKRENFTYDDTKVTNEQEKAVYDSAAKYFNNTTRSHEFVEKVAKISKDKGTNYGFINNEELKSLGHDVEGKQVNGLVRTNQDGKQTVLINIDSPKALNTIVGHETTHLLEGTQEYKDLQEAIFNYAKEQGDYNGRLDSLNSLYEGIENANIDAELTADLVGDYLFTDEQFINSLSTNKPTVFQKIKELIDDLVVRFTGTKEEKALREVQKRFKEAYRQNATQTSTDTKYAVSEAIKGLDENQLKIINGEVDVYHGTDADITEMTSSKGKGMNFFSTNPKISKTYSKKGNVNSNRIKMTNPLVIEGNGAYYNQIEFQGGKYKTEQIANWARENGYDGVVFKNIIDQGGKNLSGIKQGESRVSDVFVTFDSNQSQVVEKGIKFSLSEKGTLQDSEGNDVTLETSETGTHGTLMAIHNLTEDKMKGILELGGFPIPSIAVTNNYTSNANFGEISVLFDKNTIDPEMNAANKVYSRDAYTTRIPKIANKLNESGLQQVSQNTGLETWDLKDRFKEKSLDEAVNDIKRNENIIDKYLERKGIEVEPIYRDFKGLTHLSQKGLQNFINEHPEFLNLDPTDILSYSTYEKYYNDMHNLYVDDMVKKTNGKATREQVEALYGEYPTYNHYDWFVRDLRSVQELDGKQQLDEYATKDAKEKHIDYNSKEYNDFVRDLISPLFGEKYVRNNKDYYTSSGNPRSFDQRYEKFTLDNIVKIMNENKGTGQEGGFFTGINELAADASKRFNSIEDIKNNENLLETQNREEYQTILNQYSEEMSDLKYDILESYGDLDTDSYIWKEKSISETLKSIARKIADGKKTTTKSVISQFEKNYIKVNEQQADRTINLINNISTLPTDYFEAKPQRAVGLDEAQAIVIPNTTDAEFKQQLQDAGLKYYEYDPNIEGDRQRVINQFDDLKFSLSQQGEEIESIGDYNVYGEDVKLAIAPLQEEIKDLSSAITDLRENIAAIAPVPEVAEVEYTQPSKAELDNLMALQEAGGTEYANTFFGLRDKYGQRKLYKGIREYSKAPDTYEAPIKGDEFAPTPQDIVEQQNEEAFNNIDESNMPMEMEDYVPDGEISEAKSLFDTRDYEDVGNRKVNAYQYDNPEVKPYFQQEAKNMLGDLKRSVKGERGYNDQVFYESGGEEGFYGVSRQTTNDIAELLDGVDGKYKYTYAEIEKGLNAIIKDEGSENNAVSKRIEFYLDQRLREGYTDMLGNEIPANQEYMNVLKAREFDDFYNSLTIDDSMMPVENVDNYVDKVSNSNISEKIAPAKEEYLAITPEKEPKLKRVKENPTYNEIAEILTEEPKTESDRNKRKWAIFKANVLDKGIVFEDLALKENNRELIAKWDYTLTSEARGQYAIGKGHNGSKSLDAIRQEVDNTGLTKDFYNYMYHKHNVDRMSLASRFEGMENKPVFGDSVTAEISQNIVNQYENQHPEFMDFAQDVYDYVNADKQLLVDNGVISQETADLWSEMYPHYVPTRRTTDTGIDINVPLDTMKTGINSPIKKATGGSADILPLFDTMAMRTLQTYRATAKNSFGVELLNTIGTTVESNQTNVDEVIDSIDAQDGLLQEGKKGKNPTFTVFDGGEKITFEITKDMYDALKPVSESSFLSKTIKPLNIAGNIRRGLLTEYNPTFMLTNAIKDTQDILLNSQHSLKTYAKIPEAHKQLLTKGYWYQEYIRNGGEQNSYFDNESNTFKTENKSLAKKIALAPLNGISKLNNYVEMIPRLAEYIASRQSGASIEVAMLDAARVTTNFKAGGAVTKWANRNGATFLNASVQGAMQQVRNIREAKANGVRGWVNLATKFTMAALPAVLLNNLVWEDDEEYEELSDYVKQNYYVVGKNDDGTFIRIPKGRAVAVIQEGINQMENLITGDDEADLKTFIDLTINNLAPNNPLDNNIFSPIAQVAQNKTWYGGDLVPTRLQDLPKAEQYDESTDEFSKWIGEIFNVSPYKVNYLLDQYSGGVGDVVLPMMTPEATSDAETIGGYLTAPFKSKFTTNSTMNNQNISDFYDISEELITNAKKSDATDKDVLSNKYINSIKADMNELYKEKREIQNSDLSKSEKYEQVLDIQSQINELAENALSEYSNVSSASNYSTVGDREYYKRINEDGEVEWTKVKEEEAEDLSDLGLSRSEKNTYFKTKSEISSIVEDYKDNKSNLSGIDEDSDEYKDAVKQLSNEKKTDIVNKIKDTGFSDEQKAYLYKKYYNSDTIDTIVSSGINVDAYLDYSTQDIKSDKDKDGDSIPNSRKKKVIKYVNGLDLSVPEKAILIKATNTFKFNDYNKQIISYVSELDISYEEKVNILEELDMKVLDDGRVIWE